MDSGIIIVTGSNGRIGEAVMRRLAGRFGAVVGFDRKAPAPPPPGCVYVPVDITSDESVRAGLQTIREHHGQRVISVIHLAAYYDFLGEPSPKYDEITVEGTRRTLLRTARVRPPGRAVHLLEHDARAPARRAGPVHRRGLADRADLGVPGVEGPHRAAHPRRAGRHPGRDAPDRRRLRRRLSLDPAKKRTTDPAHLRTPVHQPAALGSTAHGQSFLHMDDLVDAAIDSLVERRAALPPELPLLLGELTRLTYDELQHTFVRLIHGDHGDAWETVGDPGCAGSRGQDRRSGCRRSCPAATRSSGRG